MKESEMDDWPVWVNFLAFLALPLAIVFIPLLWAMYRNKDDKENRK